MTDVSKLSDQELLDIINEKEPSKKEEEGSFTKFVKETGNKVKAFGAGVNAGVGSMPAVGTMGVDGAFVELPRAVTNLFGFDPMSGVAPVPTTSTYFDLMRKGGMASEEDYPQNQTMFRFGEGFGASAPFGVKGGVPGMAVTGTLGGLSNVAGKGLFPESPTGQFLFGAGLPLATQTAASLFGSWLTRGAVNKGIVKDQQTGVSETRGQVWSNPELLAEERRVASTIPGYKPSSEFALTQADDMEKFLRNIQDIKGTKKLTDQELSDRIYKAFQEKSTNLLNAFKSRNKAAFDAARTTGVDFNAPVINVDRTIKKIDELLAQYSNPEVGVPDQRVINGLKKMREEFTSKPSIILDASGKNMAPLEPLIKISLERLQQNLSSLGTAAYKGMGTGSFGDASPGVVKGISRAVLGALKDDMDAASVAGNKGVDALKDARTIFKTGLAELDAYNMKPLVKYFDKEHPTALTPEKVIRKMNNLVPTEQAELIATLGGVRPDIVNNLRVREMSRILDKASLGDTAPVGSPRFSLDKALNELGSLTKEGNKHRKDWLFTSKEEENKFKMALGQLQRILQQNRFADGGSAASSGIKAGEFALGAAGGAKVRYAAEGVIQGLKSKISNLNNERLALLMFDPNGQRLVAQLASPKPEYKKIEYLANNARVRDILSGKVEPVVSKKGTKTALQAQAFSAASTAETRKTEAEKAFERALDPSQMSDEELMRFLNE